MAIPVTVYDVFDAVINKNTPFHEYEPYVEYWHTHETGNTLQEFLCMTNTQYEAFLHGKDPSCAFITGNATPHNQALIAFCADKRTVVPGDKVLVTTEGLRMWGTQVRSAPGMTVEAEGTVMQISFEKNYDTGTMEWHGEAWVNLPIQGSEQTHDKLVTINKENCRRKE